MKVILSADEWYPWYDIEEFKGKASPYSRIADIDAVQYKRYKDLLDQIDKVQRELYDIAEVSPKPTKDQWSYDPDKLWSDIDNANGF